MWTRFSDMHSGGGRKTKYDIIYIETNPHYAQMIFMKEFKRDPSNTTCNTCGEDFSISGYGTLEDARKYEFNKENIFIMDKSIIDPIIQEFEDNKLYEISDVRWKYCY